MTAWLEFAKQHLNDSESMKERFSGLMRQELNSLASMPNAISTESQVQLIPSLWGSMVPALSFGDASEEQVLENWSELSEKSHTVLVVFTTL